VAEEREPEVARALAQELRELPVTTAQVRRPLQTGQAAESSVAPVMAPACCTRSGTSKEKMRFRE
jgi:hypothetical protein